MFSTLSVSEGSHEQGVWSLKWLQNQLISGGADSQVKIWDSQLNEVKAFSHHSMSVINVETYNNKAISHSFDGSLCYFDLESGIVEKKLEFAPVDCFHTQIYQNTIARTCYDGSVVLMDLDGKDKCRFQSKKDVFVFNCCFNNDGKRLVAGLQDGSVAVFDVESQKLIHNINAHQKPVRQVSISPDQKYIVTASYDRRVCVIDL
eukprot:NODE_26_length_40862_cov_0.679513.p21 type:complete len:204 gc:universal NODE_26_length_40862_cov_0.679513:28005-28616(+)